MAEDPDPFSRRDLLGKGFGAAAGLYSRHPIAKALKVAEQFRGSEPFLQGAIGAGDWLLTTALREPGTAWWEVIPGTGEDPQTTLYTGVPGITLFFLALHERTGEARHREAARSSATWLAENFTTDDHGLYSGLAGVGYVLHEASRRLYDPNLKEATRRVLQTVVASAQESGAGVLWDNSLDVISGSAGIGLYLLYADRELASAESYSVAIQAADRLLELGNRETKGLSWKPDLELDYSMPNFSHGTAGIGFFLAKAFEASNDSKYLGGAEAAAEYLISVADTANDGFRVFHNEKTGLDRFYLGWCHGPVGTSRLFMQLAKVTREKKWFGWVSRCAATLKSSGIPQERQDGFWENYGRCCGDAGVIEFWVDMYRSTKNKEYMALAQKEAAFVLSKGREDRGGLKWICAENRAQPTERTAQTGLMQGAAGIGLSLLRLEAAMTGRKRTMKLPDEAI